MVKTQTDVQAPRPPPPAGSKPPPPPPPPPPKRVSDMTVKTQAPWSDATVKALNELQTGKRYGHPYTCENRGDGNHHHNGNDLGCLDATPSGWICPDCDYTQDWHVGIMPAANAFDELLKR